MDITDDIEIAEAVSELAGAVVHHTELQYNIRPFEENYKTLTEDSETADSISELAGATVQHTEIEFSSRPPLISWRNH